MGLEPTANFPPPERRTLSTIGQALAGQGVGEIHSIESVETILAQIDQEARDAIQNLSTLI